MNMKRKKKAPVFLRSLFISILVFSLSILSFFIPLTTRLDFLLYDYAMRLTSSFTHPSDAISLVLLDQESIDWALQEKGWNWPWPREAYGDIVRYFNLANAASLTFDVLFTEPSLYGNADDENFAQACRENGKVVHTFYYSDKNKPPLLPIPSIRQSAALLGDVTGTSDEDKVARRVKNFTTYNEEKIPSLGLAPLLAAGIAVETDRAENPKGQLLRFQENLERYVPYSASDILQSYYAIQRGDAPLLEVEQFAESFIFFGFFAPGLFDITATPISTAYPGVGVHVTQLDNYLQNSFIKEIPFILLALALLLSSFASILPIGIHEKLASNARYAKLSGLLTSLSFIFLIASYSLVYFFLFYKGVYVPLASFFVSLFLGFAISVIISYTQEGKQRRYIKNAFKQYLSPIVIEQLIANPDKLKLGGERRNLSIFFSDVQGFTSISEKLNPSDLTSLLNDYLSEMTDIILASGGTIDKYEGDAIIAFWNAPLDLENHAQAALEAAVKCQSKLDAMRPELEKRAGQVFLMRIGINTGEAVVGNMGSHSRFDYSMLGDSVNLAARLEGFNKQFDSYTMCSEATKNAAQRHGCRLRFRELGKAAVVGKSQAVRVFEPMTEVAYENKKQSIDIFEKALKAFYDGDFLAAKELFTSIAATDPPAKKYLEKIIFYENNPLSEEEKKNWEGIWVATTK